MISELDNFRRDNKSSNLGSWLSDLSKKAGNVISNPIKKKAEEYLPEDLYAKASAAASKLVVKSGKKLEESGKEVISNKIADYTASKEGQNNMIDSAFSNAGDYAKSVNLTFRESGVSGIFSKHPILVGVIGLGTVAAAIVTTMMIKKIIK